MLMTSLLLSCLFCVALIVVNIRKIHQESLAQQLVRLPAPVKNRRIQ